MQRQYIIGTAGHIDHGKTALVQKLTGIDTDSLKEEKQRGITIDLGFAHLSQDATIIDVPGHERLIKNMIAGVSTIDLVLFVVAADDGVMPQTREHLDIIDLLGIQDGIFVITKCDTADQEWIALVQEELRDLLKSTHFKEAPIIQTSTINGLGIDTLKSEIERKLKNVAEKSDDGIFRLPVDRTFTKAGFGSIITGSVISGQTAVGDHLEILPERFSARVRGLQTHNQTVEHVKTGYRAAVNLTGVDHAHLRRGQVLTQSNYYEPVRRFNAHLRVLTGSPVGIRNRMRLRIHLHTTEGFARIIIPELKEIAGGQDGYVQFQLEEAIYASYRDRFIIRQYSPQITLGGGIILQTNPPRFKKKYLEGFKKTLRALESGNKIDRILAAFSTREVKALPPEDLQVKTGLDFSAVQKSLDLLGKDGLVFPLTVGKKQVYLSLEQIELIMKHIQKILEGYHKKYPGRSGMSVPEMLSLLGKRFPEEMIHRAVEAGVERNEFILSGETLAWHGFRAKLSDKEQKNLEQLESLYLKSEFNPPLLKEVTIQFPLTDQELRELITILRERQKLIPVDEQLFFHSETMERAINLMKDFFREHHEMKVAQFKDLTNTTRKYAIPLLTYFDNSGITRREGDVRLAGQKLK